MKPTLSLTLSIPEPCSQPWDEMTRAADGRFCSHCTRQVVDFTKMTDEAMLDYIQKHGLGCGTFREDQLGREIKRPVPPRKISGFKWLISLVFFLGWIKDGGAQKRIAKKPATTQTHTPGQIVTPESKRGKSPVKNGSHSIGIKGGTSIEQIECMPLMDATVTEVQKVEVVPSVEGMVRDGAGYPIPGAQVIIYEAMGAALGRTVTDSAGKYFVSIPESSVLTEQDGLVMVEWKGTKSGQHVLLKHTLRSVADVTLEMPTRTITTYTTGMVTHVYRSDWSLINPKEPTKQVSTPSGYFR